MLHIDQNYMILNEFAISNLLYLNVYDQLKCSLLNLILIHLDVDVNYSQEIYIKVIKL